MVLGVYYLTWPRMTSSAKGKGLRRPWTRSPWLTPLKKVTLHAKVQVMALTDRHSTRKHPVEDDGGAGAIQSNPPTSYVMSMTVLDKSKLQDLVGNC